MRAYVLSAVAALGLAVAATPSFAQGFGIHVGPGGGGVYVNPGHRHYYDDDYSNWRVTRSEAIRIARKNGMEDIYDVDRTPKHWIVRGRNWKGHKVAMRISRYGDWGWY